MTRATIASITRSGDWLAEGYHKFGQNGRSYIIPDASGRNEIVIPSEKLRWLTNQPDDVSSVRAAHYDMLQADYNFTDPYLIQSVFHERVIHKNLARKVDHIIPDIYDEIAASVDDNFGLNTDKWTELPVWDIAINMFARISNRLFVGLPLCRDKDFLKQSTAFAMDVVTAVALLPFFPSWSLPVVARLMTIPNHFHYWRTSKHTMPIILQRLKDITSNDPKLDIPEDYITWHIRTALAESKQKELEPEMIAKFIMPIEFAALHTTALTSTMLLFDLFSSDPVMGFVEGIREEAERLFEECNGKWNKPTLAKMFRADSAIKESMRLSVFTSRGTTRKIVAKNGLHNDEEGWTAPFGSFISVDLVNRHHDPSIFEIPDVYDAFRYSRPREQFEAEHPDKKDSDEFLKMRNLSLTSTGEDFLSFGHGRHACPGRFLVQHELKMMLAYITMNYEIPLLAKRPANQWLATSIIPPTKATLKVRRRAV
ncbi:related to cytochrome P450 [Ramularia collo-cygni]|uniref:Related to cytochrome P450 n=1 Tax=Ramularia collo-cygni TaxID=112498 RepID=A0A2D3V5X4_9PEZI|nr:related to cytochrome P450 [Ramularia collo-cygni]CZT24776.1 related to cytochrome P450 [Ramularia collo-cygni]